MKDTIKAENVQYYIDGQPILQQHGPFSFNREDLVCVHGPSGGGKTTLLNLLAGLCLPDSGKVMWGDVNIKKAVSKYTIDSLRMQWISMIFQEPRLAKKLNGWENIYLPLKVSGRFNTLDKALLEQLLNTFFVDDNCSFSELDDKLRRPVTTYSSGQMQRIAIVRSIMTLPKYIFADEILNSVEPQLQDKTWAAIKTICKQRNIGFLLVTHNPGLLHDPDFNQNIRVENGAF